MLILKGWFLTGVVLLATLLPVVCVSRPLDREAEKSAVAKVIDNNIAWFKDKNFELLFGTYTQGPDLFMYQLDSASTIVGFEAFKNYSAGWKNPDVKYAGHKYHELTVHLSQAGDTAWFQALLEDCFQAKDRPARCFTTRVTGVLEKRADRWLIVQQHFSLPAEKIAEDWAARSAHPPTQAVEAARKGETPGVNPK
jgi:ketosteroid isomerase-like protein